MPKLLPYLNVLELDHVNKASINRIIVIDQDDEVKVSPASSLGVSDYNELENKPIINGVTLEGDVTSDQLGVPSVEGTQQMIDEGLNSVRLEAGNGIDINHNVISVDFNTIDKPTINGLPIGDDLTPNITFDSTNTKVEINIGLGDQIGSASIPVYDLQTNSAGILNTNIFHILNDKYTKEEINNIRTEIDRALLGKQDDLIPGANISIIDNVISAFDNHFFVNLDSDEGWADVYAFIKSHLDYYVYGYREFEGHTLIMPMATYERAGSVYLVGYYIANNIMYISDYTIVENGNISRHYSNYSLDNYSKEEINNLLAALKSSVDDDIRDVNASIDNINNIITNSINARLTSLEAENSEINNRFNDYYTKQESDNKYILQEYEDSFLTVEELQSRLDLYPVLLNGGYIKTINNQPLYGSGNVEIKPNYPSLKYNYDSNTFDGDFDGVFNAVNSLSGVFSVYLPFGTVARVEATNVIAIGNTIQAVASITYNDTVNYLNYIIFRDGTYESNNSTFETAPRSLVDDVTALSADKQDRLIDSGDDQNIKTINGLSILGSGNLEIGGSGSTGDYSQLINKPSINGVVLNGNKTYDQLGLSGFVIAEIDEYVDTNNIAKISDIPTNNNQLANGADYDTVTSVNQKISDAENQMRTLYVALDADVTELTDRVDSLPNIPTDNSELTNGAGYATLGEVTQRDEALNNEIMTNRDSITAVQAQVDDLFIPTRTNQLYNDAGFITEADLAPYATNARVDSVNNDLLSLSSQVVKTYSGSSSLSQVRTIRVLTQAEYNAISTKDSFTLYLIVE